MTAGSWRNTPGVTNGTNRSSTPLHFVAALERKPAWLDLSPAIRDWNLPQSFERLRKTFKEQLGPRTGERHYIRVLQLLTRHPATRIDQAIGRLIHKPTVTAEGIAQASDRLGGSDDAQNPWIDGQQNEALRRVQVPMPDLRRFDRLLSVHTFEGEQAHDDNEFKPPAAGDAAAAQFENPEAADDAQRVCQTRP